MDNLKGSTFPLFFHCSQSVLVSDSRPPFESWARFLISRGESGTEIVKPGRVLHSNVIYIQM